MSSPQWHFADFRLDPSNACLWRGAEAIMLTPKAFEVLHYLVTHSDRLVPKDTLLDAVWPATAVSDAVVRIAIGELRRALGYTVQAPRFIATVPRRGYRFLAAVTQATPPDAPSLARPIPPMVPALPFPAVADYHVPSAATPLVGREAVLARLHAALAQARQGVRQVLFLTGEAGIGKTAVLETFAAQMATDPGVWLASGQCIEHYGPGEPYLPVLEALGQLGRGPSGARLGALLRRQAPTWLVQMPWLLTPADREVLQQELQGTTRERMLREFAELLETLTAETPLVLLLEDLHWSDHATLDLVTLLARRRTPAQFLLLGTYRPVETIVHGHPLRTAVQDLQRYGHATALPLAPLTVEAVTAYLTARFPGHQFPMSLARWLHEYTDGNPLFLVTMVSTLVERGIIARHEEHWALQRTIDAGELGVPEGVRPLLEQQIERLPPEAQQVVEVASAAGVTFAAAVVAAGLEAPAAQIENRCEMLARYHLVQPVGLTDWPDGTVTTRYTFTHALYQQVAYERMGVGRRVQLHQRLGIRLEAAYGSHAGEIAAELAKHFVRGQDTVRAVLYLWRTAENAAHRYAHREVVDLLIQALALLMRLPETLERAHQELDLQIALGPALVATKGYAAPEVEQTYDRARVLCAQVGETLQLFPVLRGLCLFYRTRGELLTARALGEQLDQLAQREAAPTLRLEAHEGLGTILFHLGEYAVARTHLEQGIGLTNLTEQRSQVLRYGEAPGVRCLALAANTLWCLGYPTQAAQRSQEALALAQELSHPHSLALAQYWAAFLHCCRREAPVVQAQAEALLTLATAQGFPLWVGFGTFWYGWALAVQGQGQAGMAQMHQGFAAVFATGQAVLRPFYLLLLAEAAEYAGQVEEGLRLLAESLALIEASARGDLLPEAYRLQGALLLRQATPDVPQAEACFQQALTIARRQQAKSWELRTAMNLARLWQQQGKHAAAHQLLADVYSWFTEGFDTADLREAAVLRETLAPGVA